MDYNFVERKNCMDACFGITWYDDDGEEIGTDWYNNEEERQEAIDRWYADIDNFTPEQ